jgi:hypothetical protein
MVPYSPSSENNKRINSLPHQLISGAAASFLPPSIEGHLGRQNSTILPVLSKGREWKRCNNYTLELYFIAGCNQQENIVKCTNMATGCLYTCIASCKKIILLFFWILKL